MAIPKLFVVTVFNQEGMSNLEPLLATKQSIEPFANDLYHLILIKDSTSQLDSNSPVSFEFGINCHSLELRLNDSGIYDAFNFAIRNIKSEEHIIFINAGDLLYDGVAALNLSQNIWRGKYAWGYGNILTQSTTGRLKVYKFSPFIGILLNLGIKVVHQQGTIYQVGNLKELGFFDSNLKISADMLMHYKLAKTNKPLVINYVIAKFFAGGLSSRNRRAHFSEWVDTIKTENWILWSFLIILRPGLIAFTTMWNRVHKNYDYI
jgi:hypothetical protein